MSEHTAWHSVISCHHRHLPINTFSSSMLVNEESDLKVYFPGVPLLLYQVPSPYRAPYVQWLYTRVGWDGWGTGRRSGLTLG